jgi:SAM-dependent methyltransferase
VTGLHEDPAGNENGVPSGIDVTNPNVARIYDYFLGGKDNYIADQQAAEQILQMEPTAIVGVRQNREFLGRVVRFLAREGVRQFLDIGTGLPTMQNVHQIAQSVRPDAHVVYVDNDAVVCTHARALMEERESVGIVEADVRDVEAILSHPTTRRLIDFDQPFAVLVVALLHFVSDADDPGAIVRRLYDALPRGGYLVLTHVCHEGALERIPDVVRASEQLYENTNAALFMRTKAEISGFFDGMSLVEPGQVYVQEWGQRAPENLPETARDSWLAGVVRK